MANVPVNANEQLSNRVSGPHKPRRLATAVDAPRPLCAKSAALLARKRQRVPRNAAALAAASTVQARGTAELSSEDGAVAYVLRRARMGLSVVRTQRRPLDAHVIQSLLFSSGEEFDRWCESDPVRFEHPMLYEKLRRAGDELLVSIS